MRATLPLLALFAVAMPCAAACSGGGTQPLPDANVSGTWHLTATASDTFSTARTSCTLGGTVTLTQTGSAFAGQLAGSTRACSGPGATAGAFDGAVSGGQVVGDSLTFRTTVLSCVYAGAVTEPGGAPVSGFVNCAVPRGSIYAPFYGTFQLTR
jgi:hypothetical protein